MILRAQKPLSSNWPEAGILAYAGLLNLCGGRAESGIGQKISGETWIQEIADAAVDAAGCGMRMGCFFQYVSDRQHHSSGPNQ